MLVIWFAVWKFWLQYPIIEFNNQIDALMVPDSDSLQRQSLLYVLPGGKPGSLKKFEIPCRKCDCTLGATDNQAFPNFSFSIS